jgi:hypothetical protein
MTAMDWMDAKREAERDREVLKRILALLVSLAALTDRVSCLPLLVRVPVLRFLRPAEAIARAFIIGMAHDLGAPTSPQGFDMSAFAAGSDAARLAQSFRVLALILNQMLSHTIAAGARTGHFMVAGTRGEEGRAAAQKLHHVAQTGRRGQHRLEPRPHDTS